MASVVDPVELPEDKTSHPKEFPARIKVSGFPLALCGWNSTYEKTDRTSDGAPVYELHTYRMLWTSQILAVHVYRKAGVWYMDRKIDGMTISTSKHLLGVWRDEVGTTGDLTVSAA